MFIISSYEVDMIGQPTYTSGHGMTCDDGILGTYNAGQRQYNPMREPERLLYDRSLATARNQ